MIRGIGIDLADILRFKNAGDLHELLEQVLTPRELDRVSKRGIDIRAAAVLFSAKEALIKALGCGLTDGWHWHDIEISEHFQIGLTGHLEEVAIRQSVARIQVSYSLTENQAIALVLLDG